MRDNLRVWVLVAVVLALGSRLSAGEPDRYVLTPSLPAAQALGTYSGSVRVTLGEVTDAVWAHDAKRLGVGPNGIYNIELPMTRQESVRSLFADLLEKTGLGRAAGPDALVVDVTLRRDRFFIDETAGRWRIRTEVFLECTFRRGGEVVGRVLACGNAQTHAQVATKKKAQAVYTAGLQDAIFKLLRSRTFLGLVGEAWKAGTGEPPDSRYEITPIAREKFYGPSDFARLQLQELRSALAGRAGTALVLEDLAMKDEKFAKKEPQHVEFASASIPELVREHLDAFYPGAFASVTRRKGSGTGENLAVGGDLLRYKEGDYALRALVGFGAGKDKLEADILFKDGRDGKVLFTFHLLESNWGGIWQVLRGQLIDMTDQTGRDLAYLLVGALVPDYAPPKDLEVCFDGVPYPPPASTRNE